MQKQLLSLGFSVGLTLSFIPAAFAVQPAPVERDSNVQWSQVINDPFDGLVVYDKNFDPSDHGFAFVSSWSKQGIRATYTQFDSAIVGYRTVWKTRWIHPKRGESRREDYPQQEPIYHYTRIDNSPKSILFAVNGKIYSYSDDAVPSELAAALASAPPGNMRVRLVWQDGKTTDMTIGKNTVAAWKVVFQPESPDQTRKSLK